jgi:TPR repeat protein
MSYEQGEKHYNNNEYIPAFKILAPLAFKGDKRACHLVGKMMRYGDGVPKDIARGIDWLEKAANEDYTPSQFSLGYLYAYGDRKTNYAPNYDKAVFWLEKAAKKDHAEAQCTLGIIQGSPVLDSNITPKRIQIASEWLNSAIKLGFDNATEALIALQQQYSDCFNQLEKKKVYVQCVQIIKECENKMPKTMIHLGRMYCEREYCDVPVPYKYEEGLELIERGIQLIESKPNEFGELSGMEYFDIGQSIFAARKGEGGKKIKEAMIKGIEYAEKGRDLGAQDTLYMMLAYQAEDEIPSDIPMTIDGMIDSMKQELETHEDKINAHNRVIKGMESLERMELEFMIQLLRAIVQSNDIEKRLDEIREEKTYIRPDDLSRRVSLESERETLIEKLNDSAESLKILGDKLNQWGFNFVRKDNIISDPKGALRDAKRQLMALGE